MKSEERKQKVLSVVEQLSRELNPQHPPTITSSTHLEWDLGLGSIERHELLLRLEQALGEKLSSQGVFQASTVSDLVDVTPGAAEADQKTRLTLEQGEVPPHPAHAENLIEALLYQAEHQATSKTLHFLEEGELT